MSECRVGCDACDGTGIAVVKHGERASNGKTRFSTFWWGYNPNIDARGVRAQEFNADLEAFQARHGQVHVVATDDAAKARVTP
jgi:hypothetical protein